MRGALAYLVRTRLKNQLRSLVQKPSRLIYLLFLAAMLALTMLGGGEAYSGRTFRPMEELTACAVAIYAVVYLLTANAGFSRGGNLFTMQDVNFLFPAPVRPVRVLFYGLYQQMTTSILLGFFLLFQYANLHNLYGIAYGHLIGLLLLYALMAFSAQVTAMLLYALTAGSERRRRVCQAGFVAVSAAFALFLAASALPGPRAEILARAASAVNSTVFRCFPVAGWLGWAADGILTGTPPNLLLGLGLCAGFLTLMVALILRVVPDFYEDVLKSAELSQSAITAKKEGTLAEAVPQNVKVGRTGLARGRGASVFFWKHLLENRRGRKLLLSPNALIFAAVLVGFALFWREDGLMPIFLLGTYFQLFTVLAGRFNRELTRPYLYLIPEPPLKKLVWALAESLPSALLEALVIFVPVGAILGLTPGAGAACVIARVSFALLFLTADVATMRVWGGSGAKGLVFLLFFGIALAMSLPGIVLAFVSALGWGFGAVGILLAAAACNLAMCLLALFLCRNMLEYAELNNQV